MGEVGIAPSLCPCLLRIDADAVIKLLLLGRDESPPYNGSENVTAYCIGRPILFKTELGGSGAKPITPPLRRTDGFG